MVTQWNRCLGGLSKVCFSQRVEISFCHRWVWLTGFDQALVEWVWRDAVMAVDSSKVGREALKHWRAQPTVEQE